MSSNEMQGEVPEEQTEYDRVRASEKSSEHGSFSSASNHLQPQKIYTNDEIWEFVKHESADFPIYEGGPSLTDFHDSVKKLVRVELCTTNNKRLTWC